MAPREQTQPFPDQYLRIEYDVTVGLLMPRVTHTGGNQGFDVEPNDPPDDTDMNNNPTTDPILEGLNEDTNDDDDDMDDVMVGHNADTVANNINNPNNTNLGAVLSSDNSPPENSIPAAATLADSTSAGTLTESNGTDIHSTLSLTEQLAQANHTSPNQAHPRLGPRLSQHNNLNSSSLNINHRNPEIDPLSIDMTNPEDEESWNIFNTMVIDAAMAMATNQSCVISTNRNRFRSFTDPSSSLSPASRNASVTDDKLTETPNRRQSSHASMVSPPPFDVLNTSPSNNRRRLFHQRPSLGSVLDQVSSLDSCSEDDAEGTDTAQNISTLTATTTADQENDDFGMAPSTPEASTSPLNFLQSVNSLGARSSHTMVTSNMTTTSPVRRSQRPYPGQSSGVVVTDEDTSSASSFSAAGSNSPLPSQLLDHNNNHNSHSSILSFNPDLSTDSISSYFPSSPHRSRRSSSLVSIGSSNSIHWTSAFHEESSNLDDYDARSSRSSSFQTISEPNTPNAINLSFNANTTVADLKYFAERGCIVPLLRALDTPRLKTLGTRMLADYAKMPHRRVAVASNKRILEFCCRTILEMPSSDCMGTEWPAREYAVETIRSLTATEDSDGYLMGCPLLLKALAIVAKGGPFIGGPTSTSDLKPSSVSETQRDSRRRSTSLGVARNISPSSTTDYVLPSQLYNYSVSATNGLVSGKARLHACIAIMNLSCGKANKIEIGSIPEVLDAMRVVMMAPPEHFAPPISSPSVSSSSTATPKSIAEEARLKATTCIKNLSNADANDNVLLESPGLIEALGFVAGSTCSRSRGATNCTTNACLALMNLSISKGNKYQVFKTKGVMDNLMTVITRTSPRSLRDGHSASINAEARIKACSALSNLAIGYENKIPMFAYPGFVDSILEVIKTDTGEARTKACSILWSFAAEMKNQVPVVKRGDILPILVQVAEEDNATEARFKCVAALTLLAESPCNSIPLLEAGALHPLMDILHEAGADPTQWKGQTASWCVGFLMNIAQSDEAVPFLSEAGVVELLAPLLTLDHYQSLKAAMAVTFVCRYDEGNETYDLLRKTENVIPKIINLLHNTLTGRGGNGYKYGVFTLRSSVGCISSLASGPEFMKERIATETVFESLLRVVTDFCVNGGTKGAIVGGGRDDALSSTLAVQALHALTEFLIPIPGSSALPFGPVTDQKLITALDSFEHCKHPDIKQQTRNLAADAKKRIKASKKIVENRKGDQDNWSCGDSLGSKRVTADNIIENSIVASLVQGCCIGPSLHPGNLDELFPSLTRSSSRLNGVETQGDGIDSELSLGSNSSGSVSSETPVRTFLLTDSRTGRRYAVPTDPSGGRAFNDGRIWCYRRGRFCKPGESPDPNFRWTDELQAAYAAALVLERSGSNSSMGSVKSVTGGSN
jgi:hypothetical protein